MEILPGLIGAVLYFLPTLCARKHHNRDAIFALNLLLGWTVIGWIVAMIWACTRPVPPAAGSQADSSEARPSPNTDYAPTRQQSRDRDLISKGERSTAGAYVDPIVGRFRHWPIFLIITTVASVGLAIIYMNSDTSSHIEKQTPEGVYNEGDQRGSESSLRRIGNPLVTAIPRTESAPAPSVPQPGPVHSDQRPTSGTADDEALVWVTSDRLNRRTCPDTSCGIVGFFFFREGVTIREEKSGWARVSKYYDAFCVDGSSRYVDSGNAACAPSNGIVDGQFAEWVSMQYLSDIRPADPAVGATGDYALVRSSDDYATHKEIFARAAAQLIASKLCTKADFQETGGWLKSTLNHRNSPVYFTYCGGFTVANRLYLNAETGEVFK